MTGGSNNSEFRSRSNSHKGGAGAGPAESDKKLHPLQKKLLTNPEERLIISYRKRKENLKKKRR